MSGTRKGRVTSRALTVCLAFQLLAFGLPATASAAKQARHQRMNAAAAVVTAPVVFPAAPAAADFQPVPAPLDINSSADVVPGTGAPVNVASSLTAVGAAAVAIRVAILGGTPCADPPLAATQTGPADNSFLEGTSPTLKVSDIPPDCDGEQTVVNYRVWADSSRNKSIWKSDWTTDKSVSIPSGYLFDGQPYWWDVQSADVCGYNPLSTCAHTGNWSNSGLWKMTISQKHWGSDPRWIMWKQGLGNNMSAQVNEANGNLYLKVPLGRIDTIAGFLRFGFSYNSQNLNDNGLGSGWRLYAGSGSGGGQIPVQLSQPNSGNNDTYKITFESGAPDIFAASASGSSLYIDGAGGMLRKKVDLAPAQAVQSNAFVYTSPAGDSFRFDSHGDLERSRNFGQP